MYLTGNYNDLERNTMFMNEKLIIIGASGHGKVVADIAIKMNKWKNIVFLDDNISLKSSMGVDVIGVTSEAISYKNEADFFVAIGNNRTREKIQEKLIKSGLNIVSLIHPSAIIACEVEINLGTVIMAGVVINSGTSLGNGCIINTSSSIDHDNIIGDYVHVSPGSSIAGTVTIKKASWLGVGSVVSNNITICEDCIIGAGAVVVKNITESGTYIGVPARRIDR